MIHHKAYLRVVAVVILYMYVMQNFIQSPFFRHYSMRGRFFQAPFVVYDIPGGVALYRAYLIAPHIPYYPGMPSAGRGGLGLEDRSGRGVLFISRPILFALLYRSLEPADRRGFTWFTLAKALSNITEAVIAQ